MTNKQAKFLKNLAVWQRIIFFTSLSFIFYVLSPLQTRASVLNFIPPSQEIQVGDIFLVDVNLNTEGKNINTLQTTIKFPPNLLGFVNFSKGDSIFSLWPQEPLNSGNGNISFIAGVPNGFFGQGKILTLAFNAQAIGSAEVSFGESKVLLNDGQGTEDLLTSASMILHIAERTGGISKDEWAEQIKKDTTPPEPFEIKLAKDPSLFEGKYFISFFTTDSGSGIDYYEVKEGVLDWKKISSPYLLEDQSLGSIVKVKAVDMAGNERVAEIKPPYKANLRDMIILFAILMGLGVIWWLIRKKANKVKNE
jgi:hypothetical protein